MSATTVADVIQAALASPSTMLDPAVQDALLAILESLPGIKWFTDRVAELDTKSAEYMRLIKDRGLNIRMITAGNILYSAIFLFNGAISAMSEGTTAVLVTENLGNQVLPGQTPKSGEMFAYWFLSMLADSKKPRVPAVVVDLSLCASSVVAAASAVATLLVPGGQPPCFFMPTDAVYAGRQQSGHLAQLMQILSNARAMAGYDGVIHVHVLSCFIMHAGKVALKRFVDDWHERAPDTVIHVDGFPFVWPCEVCPGSPGSPGSPGAPCTHSRTCVSPGFGITALKVPDTIDQISAALLKGVVGGADGVLECYRAPDVIARVQATLAASPASGCADAA